MTIKESITATIAGLEHEQLLLQASHDELNKRANQFQEEYRLQAGNNLNRFQQIKGSLETLKSLLNQTNGEKPNDTNPTVGS